MANLQAENKKFLLLVKKQVEKSLDDQDAIFDEWLDSLPKAYLNQDNDTFGPHLLIKWR